MNQQISKTEFMLSKQNLILNEYFVEKSKGLSEEENYVQSYVKDISRTMRIIIDEFKDNVFDIRLRHKINPMSTSYSIKEEKKDLTISIKIKYNEDVTIQYIEHLAQSFNNDYLISANFKDAPIFDADEFNDLLESGYERTQRNVKSGPSSALSTFTKEITVTPNTKFNMIASVDKYYGYEGSFANLNDSASIYKFIVDTNIKVEFGNRKIYQEIAFEVYGYKGIPILLMEIILIRLIKEFDIF